MPDTGLPWEIPYVDPTDLVRDYPQASEDLADQIAAGLSNAGNPGIGANVASYTQDTSFSTSSTTFVDITNVEVTITPTTNTSKVLVIAMATQRTPNTNNRCRLAIFRGKVAGTQLTEGLSLISVAAIGDIMSSQMVLDSPGTASPVTYGLAILTGSGTTSVNNTTAIIAIEVKP
jgi:hypothetical protein